MLNLVIVIFSFKMKSIGLNSKGIHNNQIIQLPVIIQCLAVYLVTMSNTIEEFLFIKTQKQSVLTAIVNSGSVAAEVTAKGPYQTAKSTRTFLRKHLL